MPNSSIPDPSTTQTRRLDDEQVSKHLKLIADGLFEASELVDLEEDQQQALIAALDSAGQLRSIPTIHRIFHGGSEDQSFDDWANSVIQWDEAAFNIARDMLATQAPFEYNEDEPQYYEQFTIINVPVLKAQLEAAEVWEQ